MNAKPLLHLDIDPPLATVTLADTMGRNRISATLQDELRQALTCATAHQDVRIVILQGLPDVFCAGGSQEELLGHTSRDALDCREFVRAPLDCPLPVVAAVQGHAIGGGLLLALYADLAIFSDRSSYAANFMALGFTPYLGTTYVFPARLGPLLGHEMLYTARPYRGRELAVRNPALRVVPHDAVPAAARQTAERVADAPRRSLELLKQRLSHELREGSAAAFEAERAAHLETLPSPEARARIARRYSKA